VGTPPPHAQLVDEGWIADRKRVQRLWREEGLRVPPRRTDNREPVRGTRFPVITQAWLDASEHVTPFLAIPPEVRRVIYTTNPIEALKPPAAQGAQGQGPLLQRGRGPQADRPRDQQRRAGVDRTRNWTVALLAFKTHFGDRLLH